LIRPIGEATVPALARSSTCSSTTGWSRVSGAGNSKDLGIAALQRVTRDYGALIKGDAFERGRRLRNDAIAHVLIPGEPTPELTYETIFSLHDAAEQWSPTFIRFATAAVPDTPIIKRR
jgi:hypothetical protein